MKQVVIGLYITKDRVTDSWKSSDETVPESPSYTRGDVIGGRQIVIKMKDNFATLTAGLAKLCV